MFGNSETNSSNKQDKNKITRYKQDKGSNEMESFSPLVLLAVCESPLKHPKCDKHLPVKHGTPAQGFTF